MEVDVKVERTAEARNQCDRAVLGRLAGKAGVLDQVRSDAAVHYAEHPGHCSRENCPHRKE